MTRRLVTGGAGFIGSHLVEALVARGDSVRILDNFSTGNNENIAHLKGKIEVIEGDLRNREIVTEAVRGVDSIFHHAAFISASLSVEQPQICLDINVQGSLNLFEAARLHGIKQVVFASSAAVYGDAQTLPIQETEKLAPNSPYAASKQIIEHMAELYTRLYDLPIVCLRYFNVFGPRQSPDSDYSAAIPIFIKRLMDKEPPTIFGDGGQTRDFVFVDDIVRANLLAAETPQAAGKVINVCTGEAVSVLDIVNTLAKLFPGAPEPKFEQTRAGDVYHSLGDPSLAKQIMGFSSQTPLSEGLKFVAEWMFL